MSPQAIYLCLILSGVALLTACPEPCNFPQSDLQPTVSDARKLIQALEQHKRERRLYPDQLSQLVPEYLAEQPTQLGGHKFSYTRHGEFFGLYVSYQDVNRVTSCEISDLENKLKAAK